MAACFRLEHQRYRRTMVRDSLVLLPPLRALRVRLADGVQRDGDRDPSGCYGSGHAAIIARWNSVRSPILSRQIAT